MRVREVANPTIVIFGSEVAFFCRWFFKPNKTELVELSTVKQLRCD